jgi:hypothetical protein
MKTIFSLVVLAGSFTFGLLCVNNPFVIARLIALWFRFVSGSSLEKYKYRNKRIKEVFELIDQPEIYMQTFSNQIRLIRFTGYTALFVAIGGACIFLLNGLG